MNHVIVGLINKKRRMAVFLSRLMDKKSWSIKDSASKLSFETAGGGNWDEWDRYISIEGKKAFHIGNICGTCEFFFERLDGANQGISPKVVSTALQEGISKLDDEFLSKVSLILPNGEYEVSLIEANPKLVDLGKEEDYFSNEQIQVWGEDEFWGLPHYPKIQYYRSLTKELTHKSKLFEFVVPTFPVHWLNEGTVDKYKSLISDGSRPAALCLSVLDIKEPADYEAHTDHPQHWCLTHYVVDGHHKIFSASLLNKPITLLSFLAKKECIADEKDIQELFRSF
ncbi:hypothetical protein [Virgibacillus sp. YIM 98842]|uniref:hypothetical protein n=1 Tax=Virgibacillus sp. YIM 98842 TaxID=2663533 RepID=UPI0013DAFA4A|nr:hypothetical protein [Virgibacillus sp. YIM 98842]